MTELSCRRARELAALTRADALSDADAMRLELHLQGCEPCAASVARIEGLVRLLRDAPEDEGGESDRALVARALVQGGARPPAPARASSPWVRWALAAAALVAIAVGAGTQIGGVGERRASGGSTAPRAEAHRAPASARSPERTAVAAASGETCPGVTVEQDPEARARIRAIASNCAIELTRGGLLIHVDPAARTRLTVDTPTSRVHVLGTVLSVRVLASGTEVLVERGRVRVEPRARPGRTLRSPSREIGAGERARVHATSREVSTDAATPDALAPHRALVAALGLPSDPAPATAADEAEIARGTDEPAASLGPRGPTPQRRLTELRRMLQEGPPAVVRAQAQDAIRDPRFARRRAELATIVAESYALEGRYAEALDGYASVWRGPRSSAAANALVAGADVALLRLSDPIRARGLYERYLREYPGGPLAEVAEVSRCRALRASGESAATHRCVADYRSRYPAGRLRGVADALAP